jgi:NitT/TauT family transport system ATP-binding protein
LNTLTVTDPPATSAGWRNEATTDPSTASVRDRVGPSIRLDGIDRRFETPKGHVEALRGVDLTVEPGRFCVIVGPSGCGKTTLLRILAGLDRPTSGALEMLLPSGGAPTNALVFQGRSLFPWLTVEANAGYGLKLAGVGRRERRERVAHLLELVGLSRFKGAYPYQVSEGMRQRVAFARALAVDPDLLLMDEPFGALDEQTRFILQEEVLRIWERSRKTVVLVTHSIDEAITMADRIVVMSAQPGTIVESFEVPFPRPRTLTTVRSDPRFAALFTAIWEVLREQVERSRGQVPA